ncbi:MAG TPA: PAS domain-containing protein, partial [Polyangiales bacterium]|nr:PAS domain-containing protein [Polyangiales bacterium]
HAKLHANITRLQSSLDELAARNEELASQQTDLCGMLSDGALAVLLLDESQHVRAFAGEIQLIYALHASDIGKPLAAIEHRAHDMPALPSLEELSADPKLREDDVVTRERWYLRRVLPQYGAYGDVEGTVITFVDVTRLKQSEAAARPHEPWLKAITDAEPAIISYVDDALQTV